MTVALVNQDREKNSEKRSPGLKSEKEALLIGKKISENKMPCSKLEFVGFFCLVLFSVCLGLVVLLFFFFAYVFTCNFVLIK